MFLRKRGYYWRNDDITNWKLNATKTDAGNNTVLRHLANDSEIKKTHRKHRR